MSHQLISLDILSRHEMSISIGIPRASKLPILAFQEGSRRYPLAYPLITWITNVAPRGFRTTKTGRVSGGGDNSTRRMRPKGSSYADTLIYQSQGKICRKLPFFGWQNMEKHGTTRFSYVFCSWMFARISQHKCGHPNAPNFLLSSNFSIAGG